MHGHVVCATVTCTPSLTSIRGMVSNMVEAVQAHDAQAAELCSRPCLEHPHNLRLSTTVESSADACSCIWLLLRRQRLCTAAMSLNATSIVYPWHLAFAVIPVR